MKRRGVVVSVVAVALVGCGQATNGGAPASGASGAPPVLVQVENDPAARPQGGLQNAAVVYEYLTEGGITRFSALYPSAPPGRVGPVRSARRVTIHLAQIYGAVIVYSGASTPVQQALDSSEVPHVDEQSSHGALYRIGGRQVPHNLVTDGQRLAQLAQQFRSTSALPASLWPRAAATQAGRQVARFSVPFSDQESPVFTWDAATHGWHRTEPDTGAFVDADTNAPLHAATVIVQQVDVRATSDVEDVNGQHGLDITVAGTGAAQVYSGGEEYDATWTQPQSGPPSFGVAGGGVPPIAPGLVWICLVPRGTTAVAS